jgi:hypothetical protein
MMTKDEARILLMDYIYGELKGEAKADFEMVLENDPELQEDLRELQNTRSVLKQVPLEEPSHRLMIVKSEKTGFSGWWNDASKVLLPKSGFARTAMATAAVFMLTLMMASVLKVQITTAEQGMAITFGASAPVVQQGINEETVIALMNLIREENALLAASLIEESREKQEEQLEEVMTAFAQYFEQQRENDLRLIGRGLAQLEEETWFRHIQTSEALGELIYAINQQY